MLKGFTGRRRADEEVISRGKERIVSGWVTFCGGGIGRGFIVDYFTSAHQEMSHGVFKGHTAERG